MIGNTVIKTALKSFLVAHSATKFSKMKRCLPEEVNKAADVIVERLSDFGLPVKVYEPDIYLSIPLSASLTVDEDTFKAKPPSMSSSVPEGVQGELVYLEANKKNLRKYGLIEKLTSITFQDFWNLTW